PGLDDIGVLRLAQIDGDRRAAVDAGDRIELLFAVDDVGDLAEIDRPASLLRDDDAAELSRILDFAFDANNRVVVPTSDPPRGDILVGVLHRRHHLIDADAERGQCAGLDLDEDLARHAPVDVDLRDAGDVLEHLDDGLIGQRGELPQIDRRRQDGERHRWLVVFDLNSDDLRILYVAGEGRSHQADLVAGVLNRARDIGPQAEFDEDLAAPIAGIGVDP